MKRRAFLRSAGAGLLVPSLANAGVIVINPFRFGSLPSSSDATVQDWIDRVYADGGTTTQNTVDIKEDFVAAATANSYFTAFRRLNLFVGDSVAYLHPLVDTLGSAKDTPSGAGITYAESTGAVTDGASYIDTGYTPTEATGGLSVYLRTAVTGNTTGRVPIGCRDAGSTEFFRIMFNVAANGSANDNSAWGRWGDNSAGTSGGGNDTGLAASLWHVNRESSTSVKLYKNGTSLGGTGTDAATPATPSQTIWVFGNNSGGSLGAPLEANAAMGGYGIHDPMTDAQAANYHTDLHAFNTAMGRNF